MSQMTIEQKLADLPNTPDEIAKFLIARGINGRRGSGYACPFARYIGCGVTVTSDKIVINPDTGTYLAVTKPVSEFICKFDQGDYPELVEDVILVPF